MPKIDGWPVVLPPPESAGQLQSDHFHQFQKTQSLPTSPTLRRNHHQTPGVSSNTSAILPGGGGNPWSQSSPGWQASDVVRAAADLELARGSGISNVTNPLTRTWTVSAVGLLIPSTSVSNQRLPSVMMISSKRMGPRNDDTNQRWDTDVEHHLHKKVSFAILVSIGLTGQRIGIQ